MKALVISLSETVTVAPKEEDNYYDFFHSVHMFI